MFSIWNVVFPHVVDVIEAQQRNGEATHDAIVARANEAREGLHRNRTRLQKVP